LPAKERGRATERRREREIYIDRGSATEQEEMEVEERAQSSDVSLVFGQQFKCEITGNTVKLV